MRRTQQEDIELLRLAEKLRCYADKISNIAVFFKDCHSGSKEDNSVIHGGLCLIRDMGKRLFETIQNECENQLDSLARTKKGGERHE